ncbi:MAG TPA: CBS domain-containing protein [Candidatus Bathyarchaeia archaeon]|jgi:signal-transduction protein with cAMP-binding, CBS, and nucleotidyltransferase domain|nr:CBS domain-containing protein [Candidatus Bathyarchaeia archaeon]
MQLAAKDIAQKEFVTLSRDTSALDAARMMKSKGIQFVIVSTPGSLEGIVTEWDYISKIVAEGKNPAKVRLADIMSSNLITVDANDPLDKVARLMTSKKIRRVLVLWETEVYGVITASSMLAAEKVRSSGAGAKL